VSAARHRNAFLPLLGGLVVLTWVALWAWAASPYGRYLEHGGWSALGPAAALCRAIPGGEILVPAALYAAGWIAMTAAMMLPTVLPLLDIFGRLVGRRPDARRLQGLVVAGYLAVWGAFGLAAHVLDALLLAAIQDVPALAANAWALGAAVIGLAGLYQFTDLKYRCLDQCRTPLSFVMQHWRGGDPARQALRLGVHHGAFCVGCCWALMLLMFVVGTGSVGWMLALASVMAIEKNTTWGRRLSAPLGFALLATAGATLAINL
jgi:predicted metal-binding membrane protein